jgi:hypothetical protein
VPHIAANLKAIDGDYIFKAPTVAPTKVTAGGEVHIVEKKNFPATDTTPEFVAGKILKIPLSRPL